MHCGATCQSERDITCAHALPDPAALQIITHVKQHVQNKADERTNIVILPSPIHNKCIIAFSTQIRKSGIETREFSVQMISKTINRMRTPN